MHGVGRLKALSISIPSEQAGKLQTGIGHNRESLDMNIDSTIESISFHNPGQ